MIIKNKKNMLRIFIPPNNIPEKKYIISIILSEFLGLEYNLEVHNSKFYLITFSDRKIIIENSFFGARESDDYLKIENLPEQIIYLKNEFTCEKDLPILYGSNKLLIREKVIILGADIFASSFFMLTRWEEFVNPARDNFGRFPGNESVAFKNNFINRPIVNEYVDFLWNLFKYLGFNGEMRKREFKIMPTVDVDQLFRYHNFTKVAIQTLRFIGKGKISKTWEYLGGYFKTIMGNALDPFNTYNKLMLSSERINTKSYFFFLSGVSKEDGESPMKDKRLTKILDCIRSRGHYIGFHAGFDTFDNPVLWKKAKNNLDEVTGFKNKFGRQHYLRFDVPLTWNIWEESKMEWDCTLGYATVPGFRCGTCFEFSVFNILRREQLNLKEYPLLIMDVTLKYYLGLTSQEAIDTIREIKTNVKKFNGNFVFLWHNSSFNINEWRNYREVFEELWN